MIRWKKHESDSCKQIVGDVPLLPFDRSADETRASSCKRKVVRITSRVIEGGKAQRSCLEVNRDQDMKLLEASYCPTA